MPCMYTRQQVGHDSCWWIDGYIEDHDRRDKWDDYEVFKTIIHQFITHSHAPYRCSQYNRGLDKVGGALLFKLLLDFYHTIEAAPSATTSTTLSSATMANSSTLDADYASQSSPSIRDGCNTNVCNTMESPRKLVRQSSKKKARFKDSGIMDDAYLLYSIV